VAGNYTANTSSQMSNSIKAYIHYNESVLYPHKEQYLLQKTNIENMAFLIHICDLALSLMFTAESTLDHAYHSTYMAHIGNHKIINSKKRQNEIYRMYYYLRDISIPRHIISTSAKNQ
jgi:hypothetical protein